MYSDGEIHAKTANDECRIVGQKLNRRVGLSKGRSVIGDEYTSNGSIQEQPRTANATFKPVYSTFVQDTMMVEHGKVCTQDCYIFTQRC